jgi:hypothetical protein
MTTKAKASTAGSGGGSSGRSPRSFKEIWNELRASPLQYSTIPAVAAFLGLYTNWVGVKMLFYPIEYTGTGWYICVKIQLRHYKIPIPNNLIIPVGYKIGFCRP